MCHTKDQEYQPAPPQRRALGFMKERKVKKLFYAFLVLGGLFLVFTGEQIFLAQGITLIGLFLSVLGVGLVGVGGVLLIEEL